jgi:hypothetical protein
MGAKGTLNFEKGQSGKPRDHRGDGARNPWAWCLLQRCNMPADSTLISVEGWAIRPAGFSNTVFQRRYAMFTLCFTPVAAAAMRRTRKTPKNARRTDAVVRTARIGLVSLVVVAMAGMAQAGGPGGRSLGGSSSGGNSGMQFSQQSGNTGFAGPKFNSQTITSNNIKSMDYKVTPRDTVKLDTKLNGIGNTVTNNKIATLPINKGAIDTLKNGNKPIIDQKISGLGDKIKNDKLHIDKKNPGLVDSIKDKCHDDCHDCCKCFKPCPWWYCWNYPCWCPLYTCSCGYWYDVPVVVIEEGLDLQLLAVRTIDSGDMQNGPAFRVWVRNNSRVAIEHPFNVLLLAARDEKPTQDLPQAGVRIENIQPGQVLPIDIRMPVTANQPGLPMLHVLVDSHREIPEVDKTNNGAILARAEILPVEIPQAAKTVTAVPAGVTGPTTTTAPALTTAPAAEPAAGPAVVESTETPAAVNSTDSLVPLMMRGPVEN